MPVPENHIPGGVITAADINALATLANTTEAAAGALGTTVAGKQPLDADLTTFAALDSATAGVVASDGSGWIRKSYAQLKTALGLVKGDVGLGNVDNTADTAKPISTATQTALDLKAPLASPAFTGTPTKGGSALLSSADASGAYATKAQASRKPVQRGIIPQPAFGEVLAQPGNITTVASTTGGSLPTGTTYVQVTAVNASGESLPSVIKGVSVTGATGSIAVTWRAVPGATSYNVYAGSTASSLVQQTTGVTGTTYTVTGTAGATTAPTFSRAVLPPPRLLIVRDQTSAIASKVRVAQTDSRIRYFGGPVTTNNNSGASAWNPTTASTADQGAPFFFEFGYYGSYCEMTLVEANSQTAVQVWVDGQALTPRPVSLWTGSAGSGHLLTLDFGGVRKGRTIKVATNARFYFGVDVGPTDVVYAPIRPLGPRVISMGDSFTSAAAVDNPLDHYTYRLAELLGWDDVWLYGETGTGYINPATGTGSAGRTNYQERIAEIFAGGYVRNGDTLLIYGSTNDSTISGYATGTPSPLETGARATYRAYKAAYPNNRLYVVGNICEPGATNYAQHLLAHAEYVKATTGNPDVDLFIPTTGWVTGTGRVGATTGSGNADWFVGADNLHPSTEGEQYMAERIAQYVAAYEAANGTSS